MNEKDMMNETPLVYRMSEMKYKHVPTRSVEVMPVMSPKKHVPTSPFKSTPKYP